MKMSEQNRNSTNQRLSLLDSHFQPNNVNQTSKPVFISTEVISDGKISYPIIIDHHKERPIRHEYMKIFGWGYKDSGFIVDEEKQSTYVSGNRYNISGKYLPEVIPFASQETGIDFTKKINPQKDMEIDPPVFNHEFIQELDYNFDRRSFEKWERIDHSHGQTTTEILLIRQRKLPRFCDMVVYPDSHEHCETIVKLAHKHNVVLIPFGGASNVTESLKLPTHEKRMIVTIDMGRMNRIKWLSKQDQIACVEAGVSGKDLEASLEKEGMCSGFEPDSMEFSTLGGWISTRASGMKKNRYGNIEDILQNVRYITPVGQITNQGDFCRISGGPDFKHIVLGSEGNYGLISEAIIRIKPLPEVRQFGSIIFYSFEDGLKFIEEIGRSGDWPASVRLVDNLQFRFGLCFKPESSSRVEHLIGALTKYYVLNVKGFDPNKMAACTLLFEGTKQEVFDQQKRIYSIGSKYKGLAAGEESGRNGYILTFSIAYVRDFCADYNFIAESVESTAPWSLVPLISENFKKRLVSACQKRGIDKRLLFGSTRITQVYLTGACIYSYFGITFVEKTTEEMIQLYIEIDAELRDEIMKCGGSISHHHGVGKLRKQFTIRSVSPAQIGMFRSIKDHLDPKNIFALNNTYPLSADQSISSEQH